MTARMGEVEQPNEQVPREALDLIAEHNRKNALAYEQLLDFGSRESGGYRLEG